MQLNTAGEHAHLPASVLSFSSSAGIELSTVHEPADELSFYADIRKVFRESSLGLPVQWNERLSTWRTSNVQKSVSVTESAAEIIDTAKRITGLSIKDLAGIFQVSRQTLYNYRKSEETITERNWVRLKDIDSHIKAMSEVLPYNPGSLIKRVTLDGHTLYDLLCAEVLDADRIKQVAEHLAKHLKASGNTGVRYSSSIDQLTRHA